MSISPELWNWTDLQGGQWPTLIVGNGLSINFWRDFSYDRLLYHSAVNGAAEKLFADLETTNFEVVLEALWHAERVLLSTNRSAVVVNELYEHVRSELIAAIQSVHPAWTLIARQALLDVARVLDLHATVYTLNYGNHSRVDGVTGVTGVRFVRRGGWAVAPLLAIMRGWPAGTN